MTHISKAYIRLSVILLLLMVQTFPISIIAQNNSLEEEKQEEKMRPSEWFYMQRSYPERTFNLNGYQRAIQQVQNNRSSVLHERGKSAKLSADWTLQGANNIGGRINTIAVHPTNNNIILAGSPSGGIFRTDNGGVTWIPVFDNQSTLSIGSIAFAPSDPNIVFAGTGDPNISAYPFIGNGLYKSTDAGITWNYLGLSETKIISKVMVHPTNPNIIYVGAMGSPFVRDNDRGLYKTIDGGQTWKKVFFISDQAGVIDFAFPIQNPNTIYLACWDRIRSNSETIISGENSRVYRSFDAGNSFQPINNLPIEDNSRIGIAFSPTSPTNIIVSITDTDGQLKAVFRTTNSGNNWTDITTPLLAQNLYNGFGWYFGKVAISPNGEPYILGVHLWRYRNNQWENITELAQHVHVDIHDIVFRNSIIFIATDGGTFKSDTGGDIWRDIDNIAVTQCYRVAISPHDKKNYWLGTQDNGTIVGSANVINSWTTIQKGDGFRTQFLKSTTKTYFTEQQNGLIWVTRDSGASFQIATTGIETIDRKNWDTPYFVSNFGNQKLYVGTHRVYRSEATNNIAFQAISLDLTKGNLIGEQFNVISALEESKQEEGVVYAGTSDGNVWVYDKNTWYKISSELPDRYVTSVRTSPFNKNTVYVTHSGYKDNDNTPLIHISKDRGFSWAAIKGDLPDIAINDIAILPNHQDSILFAATDAGVYVSNSAGKKWLRLGNNMPIVPIYELVIDNVNNLLLAATHGRGLMSYPLEEFNSEVLINISGKITLPNGTPMKGVEVEIAFDSQKEIVPIDGTGAYFLNNRIKKGTAVKITPIKKTGNANNGISTSDIVAIQKHLLSVAQFIDPYKILAADANRSSSVSTADIVLLRKIVLTLLDTMPQSWRFVPKNHTFADPKQPYAAPQSIEINNIDAIRNDLDFIAIKSGDVNNSAIPD